MTIVIALKVGDGVVLGADSATTLGGGQFGYINTYFNAEKLFHLDKRLPLGLLTFGLGGIADRSVSSHLKDLRRKLENAADKRYFLDATSYSVQAAAERVREYFFVDLHAPAFANVDAPKPVMGFFVGGYSAGSSSAEVWQVTIDDQGRCWAPTCIISAGEATKAVWNGLTEACSRLLLGYSPALLQRLVEAGMPEPEAVRLLEVPSNLLWPAMPIQDAIDLVDYLVDMTCGYVRFAPGTPSVAKPIDTAAITQHEGFRWIHRKHFYSRDLNLGHP